jgi:DnaJ-class molecular chaperone
MNYIKFFSLLLIALFSSLPVFTGMGILVEPKEAYEVLGLNENATYYDVLGLGPSGDNDVRAAYFKLARIFHPDKRRLIHDPELAESVYLLIRHAYEVLSDPTARARYLLNQGVKHTESSI